MRPLAPINNNNADNKARTCSRYTWASRCRRRSHARDRAVEAVGASLPAASPALLGLRPCLIPLSFHLPPCLPRSWPFLPVACFAASPRRRPLMRLRLP